MTDFQSDVVLPLKRADHRFLEVLVTKFSLNKLEKGYHLDVNFTYDNLAVWSDSGKRHVQKNIPDFKNKSKEYQEKLDDFLLAGNGTIYPFSDEDFPFRHVSGGTLPIIHRGNKEYYCFFYRDIEPIGWNIANGGSDSLHELLNPTDTIERELREELAAFDPNRKEWLLFEAGEDVGLDQPGLNAVRKIISKQYPHLDLDNFKTTEIPLKWLDGPDNISVNMGNKLLSETHGCFLNINAIDFGIEVDRVARITIAPQTILFDGESWGEIVVNSPVGLFEVGRFNKLMANCSHEFLPDVFFYDAQCYENGEQAIEKAVNEYVHRISKYRSKDALDEYQKCQLTFDLCPVTRRIIQRYLSTLTEKARGEYDTFISFPSEDILYARRVDKYLSRNSNKRAFFSEATLHDGNWAIQIDQALQSCEKLILVGTSINNILKRYVEYEWRTFHLLSLTEPKDRILVPLMVGIEPKELPLPLRFWQGHFPPDDTGFESCLPKL
jgi:hypothetical protein